MEHKITWSLIIINIVVFELVFSMPGSLLDQTFDTLDFSRENSLQPWRWVTSLFLHVNASHIFFNMLALYFFGRVLEDQLSGRQWLSIYFVSGIAGSLVYGLTNTMPAVGASGCIFGLMGAAMFLKPKEMIRIYVFPLPLGLIAIMYMLSQVALAAMPSTGAGVAYVAHIGGLVAGSGLMLFYRPKEVVKGFLVMVVLLAILLILAPVFGLIVGVGQIILGVFDFIVGLALYGTAKLLLSWIWILIL